MKNTLRLCIFAVVMSVFALARAVPADPRPHNVVQPNGKNLTYFLKGDERTHWFESTDGYTLVKNEEGYLEFACLDENGVLQASGILACNIEERDEQEENFLLTITPQLFSSKERKKTSK